MIRSIPYLIREILTPDGWLEGFLGCPAWQIRSVSELAKLVKDDAAACCAAFTELTASPVFVYAKAPTDLIEQVTALTGCGFQLIDTNVVFDKPISANEDSADRIIIRPARVEDQQRVGQIAGANFAFSRFHLDPAISNQTADAIKAAWAENFWSGQRGDAMLVAEVDNQVAGFLQLLVREPEVVVIDLIAVDKTFRNQGVATGLIAEAERLYSRCELIRVGTQIANLPSIRCYENTGFRLRSSAYLFHFHSRL
ncbi:MAG: GNAT family N-acetyltransferase [Candidatus Eisenbacteria sp.]|nr:GNAT family N-acetyltransferase [Candidatus Eisenbacteria bacterium]